jgi:phage terminase large subunit GpA-like protein
VNFKKGVQITYSTLLESGVLYYADYIGTLPMMYITADKELAEARIENNFMPMFNQSGKAHIICSSDTGNSRKTGKTKQHIQFAKGAYLVPFGARNADKMRSYSIAIMLKDEVDAWPLLVGKDGDPDALSDSRTDGYTEVCKIFRGSTPLMKGTSVIERNFLRGDQRIYRVLCKSCSFPQNLRWSTKDKVGGFFWETDGGVLVLESVHYRCQNCGHKHYEHDKTRLFALEHGAHWHPTAKPATPFIRSYHLPALYSPVGMRPWWKCVSEYLEGWDPKKSQVIDVGKFQVWYNNVLAEPFEEFGGKVTFRSASGHRRSCYSLGMIPNTYAEQYSGSFILFLTCQVDVHDKNLAVTVKGWAKDMRSYIIDYWRFEQEEGEPLCSEIESPQWDKVRHLIEQKHYVADDKKEYGILLTLIDAGHSNDAVCTFCSEYETGVFPILGRDRPGKNQTIKEFSPFVTQVGTTGYKVVVDHYKDRLAPVLRREWLEEAGEQPKYHFNAPVDLPDKALRELTKETRREKIDDRGNKIYYWHRPGNAPNELWDLLVYGHAAVEMLAHNICIQEYGLLAVDWPVFWRYAEENPADFGRKD